MNLIFAPRALFLQSLEAQSGGGHVERPAKDEAATVTATKRGRLAGWKEYKEQAEVIRPR